jgi:hypothetical protein
MAKKEKEVICLNWKSFLAAAVLTALMLSLAFIKLSGSQTTFQYDPWADINDDGYIDGKDISYTCRLFGTTGDPTKNVNVTNWPKTWKVVTYIEDQIVNWTACPAVWGYSWGFVVPNINVEGYSRMFIYLEVWGFNFTPGPEIQFGIRDLNWIDIQGHRNVIQYIWEPYFNCTCGNWTYKQVKEFKTYGPYVFPNLGIYSPKSSGSAHVTITVYLRNE